MASLRSAVHSFSWLSAAEAIRVGTTALIVVYVARRLGAPVFGYYALALSVIGALLALVDGGFTAVGSREVARRPAEIRAIVGAILAARLSLAAMSFLALLGVVAYLDRPAMPALVMRLSGASLFTMALTIDWVFYGLARPVPVAAASMVRVAVFAGLTVALVRDERRVWLLPVFQAAGEVLAAALLARAYAGSVVRAEAERRGPSIIGALASQAWPLGAGQLMRAVNFWFSVILIGVIADDASAGRFAAAQRITQFALGFATLYFAGYLPLITKGLIQGREVAHRLTADSLHVTALITLPLAVGGALLADPIVRLVFGADYAPAAGPLAVLIWTVPFIVFGGHFRHLLIASDLVRVDLRWVTVSAATNVVVALALMRPLGLMGAALACALAEGVLACGAVWSVSRARMDTPVVAALVRPAAACTVMAIAVLVSRGLGLAAAIPVGILTYALALLALGERWPRSLSWRT